jgi:hypothetical protein
MLDQLMLAGSAARTGAVARAASPRQNALPFIMISPAQMECALLQSIARRRRRFDLDQARA